MIASIDENLENSVEWIEEASHPLAGSFRTRGAFLAHILKRFSEGLPQGTWLRIERVFVNTRFAVVTMWFLPLAGSELQLGYRYWWICER
jgi:uncharacterized protein